jgi:hypothetical protein
LRRDSQDEIGLAPTFKRSVDNRIVARKISAKRMSIKRMSAMKMSERRVSIKEPCEGLNPSQG